MKTDTFLALRVQEQAGDFTYQIETQQIENLPSGDVLIRVHFSSLNYKDLLVTQGARGLTSQYPHTPGIDAAGIVEQSNSDSLLPGDQVLVTGFDLGINTPGGFGQYIRVPNDWVQKIPAGLSPKDVMCFGTAGLTAGLSIQEILDAGITPQAGPIAVTGASGGVGSLAITMLATLGFSVTAITNKTDDNQRLKQLGAKDIIQSQELNEPTPKHLLKPRWAGVVDTVGGAILANLIKETIYGGVVTNCGMVAGNEMNVSVFPFLLRGVRLIGIDSVFCPLEKRNRVWQQISKDWSNTNLEFAYTEVFLKDLPEAIKNKTTGNLRGRVLVNLT